MEKNLKWTCITNCWKETIDNDDLRSHIQKCAEAINDDNIIRKTVQTIRL